MKPLYLQAICFLIVSLTLTACTFYTREAQFRDQPRNQQNSWRGYVQNTSISRPMIYVKNNHKTFRLEQYQFEVAEEPGILMGTLVEEPTFYLPQQSSFRRGILESRYKGIIMKVLVLETTKELSEGLFTIAMPEIDAAVYYRNNVGASVFATAGVVALSTTAAIIAFVAIVCNCPRIYAMGPEGPVLQGSLFTGAISKSLERTDYVTLHGLDRRQDEIEVTIKNELPEEEYLDHVRLLKVKPTPGAVVGMDATEQLFEYQHAHMPVAAQSIDGTDILTLTHDWDELSYHFDDRVYDAELNAAVFTFDKQAIKRDQVKLVIQARQTEWLQVVADYFFTLFGRDFDRWVKMMDRVPRNTYDKRVAERGMSMNAYLKTAKGWELIGAFHNAGIMQQKTLGMTLDLSKVEGNEVEIKLTAAHKFWELDRIGISEDAHVLTDFEEVPMIAAVNQDGTNIQSYLAARDKDYYVLPDNQSEVSLRFAHTATADEIYVLQGTGYYHHVRHYEHEPNKAMLKDLKKGHITTHELSQMLDQAHQYAISNP